MLIYLIVFIEGFCSLGAEIIALRRLVPHVGSSIVVTAPTIGFFLFALAIGYATGGKVVDGHLRRVARNFLLAGLIAGVGLAGPTVEAIFTHVQPGVLAYLVFMAVVLCPIAWLLGQTVPVLTNLMKHSHVGQASGMALYWSTLGSFLGSVSLSVFVMQWFGVSTAVVTCAAGLLAGALMLEHRRWHQALAPLLGAGIVVAANLGPVAAADTAYADYQVKALALPDQINPRAFMSNRSHSSQLDDSQPPKTHRYVQHLRQALLDDLGFKGKDILVLGAGGFTLSQGEPLNRYTYWTSTLRSGPSPNSTSSRDRPTARSSPKTRAALSRAPRGGLTRWWSMSTATGRPFPATSSPASSGSRPAAPCIPRAC